MSGTEGYKPEQPGSSIYGHDTVHYMCITSVYVCVFLSDSREEGRVIICSAICVNIIFKEDVIINIVVCKFIVHKALGQWFFTLAAH